MSCLLQGEFALSIASKSPIARTVSAFALSIGVHLAQLIGAECLVMIGKAVATTLALGLRFAKRASIFPDSWVGRFNEHLCAVV